MSDVINYPFHIRLIYQDKVILINIDCILYLKSSINYVYIYTNDNNIYCQAKTLKSYDSVLKKMGFVRIHKSYLVNIVYFKRIEIKSQNLYLKNDMFLPISRRKMRSFKNNILNYYIC